MSISGWCSGPTGSRLKCQWCRSAICGHECHERPVVERDSASDGARLRAESGPESASTDRGLATVSTTAKGGVRSL